MRYFRKSFIRYFAMGLAFSLLSFLVGMFGVKAESYAMPSYNFAMQYNYLDGNTSGVAYASPTATENGMSVFVPNNLLSSYFNFRYIYNVSYSNIDLVTFNARIYDSSGVSFVVDSVSAFDRPCYFTTSYWPSNDPNNSAFTTLSAICPMGSGAVNVNTSDYFLKVNTAYGTLSSVRLSNVAIIQSSVDSQAVINALSGLNYNLNTTNSKLDSLISALNNLTTQNTTINQSISDTKNAINSQAESTRQNANENTDKTINSQRVCNSLPFTIEIDNKYLSYNGQPTTNNEFGISPYYDIRNGTLELVTKDFQGSYNCFYTGQKQLISCFLNSQATLGPITIPNNAVYFRYTIYKSVNPPQPLFKFCVNGNQALYNNITSDDTTGSENSLSGVINDPTFSDSSGVNAIINLPLEFINSLNNTCSPLVLNFPYFGNISIPCMSTIYHKFAPFDTILSLVINGFVIYRVLIELFYIVKSSRDPDSDRVEVLDL